MSFEIKHVVRTIDIDITITIYVSMVRTVGLIGRQTTSVECWLFCEVFSFFYEVRVTVTNTRPCQRTHVFVGFC